MEPDLIRYIFRVTFCVTGTCMISIGLFERFGVSVGIAALGFCLFLYALFEEELNG